MISRHPTLSTSVFVSLASLLAACGGSGGSYFESSAGPPDMTHDPGGGTFADGGNDPRGTNAACVTSTANATLTPANLVFMYDRSGSMGDPNEGGDPSAKWVPLSAGMKSFLSDPASASLNASLQFFAMPFTGDLSAVCNYSYATPVVPLTTVSDGAVLRAIQATKPQGGTPTLPALAGAFAYAAQVNAQRPLEKAVVVLVTDGIPGFYINGTNQPGCANNDVTHVAAAAKSAFAATPSIPTYVIGVGPNLLDLNTIAAAGGTKQATMISVSDPTLTAKSMQSALTSIRAQSLSCDFGLPLPPTGQMLDTHAVNVAFTNGAGVENVLAYNSDCAGGTGWRYDDLAAPTKVELCGATCGTARADTAGKITIAFGCSTKGALK